MHLNRISVPHVLRPAYEIELEDVVAAVRVTVKAGPGFLTVMEEFPTIDRPACQEAIARWLDGIPYFAEARDAWGAARGDILAAVERWLEGKQSPA